MLRVAIEILLMVAALPVLAASLYLCGLAALSRRVTPPAYSTPRRRFDVIVPAHDEEDGIAATVTSLVAVDYPAELRRVIVVADNCSDATAERARAAGAEVLVRHDTSRRGKGYALQYAFERSLSDAFADAVVVVDADTSASRTLLRAFAHRLDAGAHAVQAKNAVGNAGDSWRTRLMAIAFELFNGVRSLARERLRLSAGLRGNGMCLSTDLLRAVPHDAFSVVEDLEYGIRIGEAGYRVHYAPDGEVLSKMVSSSAASGSQRRRWEGGRMRMMRQRGPGLFVEAIRRRNLVLLDLAVDLLVPPLAFVVLACAGGLAIASALSLLLGQALFAVAAWVLSALCLVAYVGKGWRMSGTGLRGLADLACAPIFIAWKVALMVRARTAPTAWVRTAREVAP